MSGHNKWSKIKHKKAASDAEKSKVFAKLVKLIKVEARLANGDENTPGLRAAVEKARGANMPKDTIARGIQSAVDSKADERVIFETYGPGGAAVVIVGLTDNTNRTTAEIKHLLSKNGFELATPGSALWAFKKTDDGFEPTSVVSLSDADGERMGVLIEIFENHDDVQDVYTNAV